MGPWPSFAKPYCRTQDVSINVKGKMISFPKLEPSGSFVVILPNLKYLLMTKLLLQGNSKRS